LIRYSLAKDGTHRRRTRARKFRPARRKNARLLNLLFALSPWPRPESWWSAAGSPCFVAGGIAMPCVCFLAAWRKPFRHLFPLPVVALVLAVAFTLAGGGR